MKKVLAAVLACVLVFSLTVTAFAAVSPTAPTVNTTRPITPPAGVDPTQQPATKPSTPGTPGTPGSSSKPTTTRKSDVDDTTNRAPSTTKRPVTSDKAPVSPDTGSYVSKTVSAAALVAIALSGAVIYTTKKKAE